MSKDVYDNLEKFPFESDEDMPVICPYCLSDKSHAIPIQCTGECQDDFDPNLDYDDDPTDLQFRSDGKWQRPNGVY